MPEKSRDDEHLRKLFIGGLTLNTSDEQLKEFYCQWGDVVDYIVMKDPTTKRSRGFGFITYSDADMLEDAMKNRPHVIDGREVDPKRAVPRDSMPQGAKSEATKRLFVSGIRDDHTEEQLTDYFSSYGEVTKTEIIADRNTGQKRGFAFVNFADYDPVDKCVLERSHMIGGHRCDVKKAESRDSQSRTPQQDRDRMGRQAFRGGRGGGRGGGRDESWGNRQGGGYGGGYGGGGGGWNQGQSAYGGGGGGGSSWGVWGQQQGAGGGGVGAGAAAYGNYAPGYTGGYSQQPPATGYGQAPSYGQPQVQTGYGGYPQQQQQQQTQWAAQPVAPQQQGTWQTAANPSAYAGLNTPAHSHFYHRTAAGYGGVPAATGGYGGGGYQS